MRLEVCCCVLALLMTAAVAEAEASPTALDTCLARMEKVPVTTPGQPSLAKLGTVCPKVAAQLDAGAWRHAFAEGGAQALSATALRDFIRMRQHYSAKPLRASLSTARLGEIVAGLEPFGAQKPKSLWQRMLAKLREWLGVGSSNPTWLASWLHRAAAWAAWFRYALYAVAIVALLGLAWVLGKAMHDAGWFERVLVRWRTAGQGNPQDEGGVAVALDLDTIARAPVASRPALLFACVVERLHRRYGVVASGSATHREVVTAVVPVGLASLPALRQVANAAEGAVFGTRRFDATECDALLAAGARVLGELDADARAELP